MTLKKWLLQLKAKLYIKRIESNKKKILKLITLTSTYTQWIKEDNEEMSKLLKQLTTEECSKLI